MTMTDSLSTLVCVIWHDAHSCGSSWQAVDQIEPDPCVVTTVGILLTDVKDRHIVLAQSATSDGDVDHVIAIPVAMVVSMQVLSADLICGVSPSPLIG